MTLMDNGGQQIATGADPADTGADMRIAYATPLPGRRSPTLAGAAVLAGGLGLVFLGGCFLIGALIVTEAARENWMQGLGGMTTSMVVLLCVLYAATFACFAGALTMLVMGTRALLRVLKT